MDNNKHSSLDSRRIYARGFALGAAWLTVFLELCSRKTVFGRDNVRGDIFTPNGDYCLYIVYLCGIIVVLLNKVPLEIFPYTFLTSPGKLQILEPQLLRRHERG